MQTLSQFLFRCVNNILVSCLLMIADRKMKAAKAAFDTSIDCGITLFDTAEVYGSRVRNEFDICCFLYH